MLPRMRRVLSLLPLAAACGGHAAAPARTHVVEASAAHRPHALQPWEMLVRGAPATGVPRAILARHGAAWLRLGGDVDESPGWHDLDGTDRAVVEMRGEHVRLLLEEDDVRLFVWVARADLAPVIAHEVALVATPGAPAPGRGRPGVTLAPGTTFAETARAGEHVAVTIAADGLRVDGFVPVAAIGDVWERAAPGALRRSHALDAGRVIRAAPDDGAPALATTTETIDVRALAPSYRGWREVTTLGPHVVVHGFVREHDAHADLYSHGTGGGYGYGSSHAMSFPVGAGTCLYDGIDGDVIGLVVADRKRLMRATTAPGWYTLLVSSPWGLLDVPIRTAAGSEPPSWERCADL